MLLALVAFATAAVASPLIAVAALGLPLLFLIYLQESDALRDLPARTLLLTAALGVALGVGWVLLTGAMVARSYGVPLGASIAGYRMLRDGLAIPLGGVILMLLPAVMVRLLRPPTREALDGFIIGALGALDVHRGRDPDPVGPAVRHRSGEQTALREPARRGGHPGRGGAVDRGGRGRVDRRGAVVHPRSTGVPGAVRLVLVLFAVSVLAVYRASV